ncbi:MAG: hypothetical protein DLM62_01525 [Pseudonocardiales bacterium]|nr:MAG: hypothetical protein DLM62_01525 [Pseudonocardiales bacterium]
MRPLRRARTSRNSPGRRNTRGIEAGSVRYERTSTSVCSTAAGSTTPATRSSPTCCPAPPATPTTTPTIPTTTPTIPTTTPTTRVTPQIPAIRWGHRTAALTRLTVLPPRPVLRPATVRATMSPRGTTVRHHRWRRRPPRAGQARRSQRGGSGWNYG